MTACATQCAIYEQCTSKQLQHLQCLERVKKARPLIEYQLDTTRHNDTGSVQVNKTKYEGRPNKGDETARNVSSTSRVDLCGDVERGHVVNHRSIGLVTLMFFSIVCIVTVAGMRK